MQCRYSSPWSPPAPQRCAIRNATGITNHQSASVLVNAASSAGGQGYRFHPVPTALPSEESSPWKSPWRTRWHCSLGSKFPQPATRAKEGVVKDRERERTPPLISIETYNKVYLYQQTWYYYDPFSVELTTTSLSVPPTILSTETWRRRCSQQIVHCI